MVESEAIEWLAPDWDHPARRAGQNSAATVARGDKQAWLGLFSPDAVIEDPVGPSFLDPEGKGHRGHAAIGQFWDKNVEMIAQFRFRVTDSFANGDSCANVTTISTTLHDGSVMDIDCILIYTVDDGGLITSLRAHWEPERSMATIRHPD